MFTFTGSHTGKFQSWRQLAHLICVTPSNHCGENQTQSLLYILTLSVRSFAPLWYYLYISSRCHNWLKTQPWPKGDIFLSSRYNSQVIVLSWFHCEVTITGFWDIYASSQNGTYFYVLTITETKKNSLLDFTLYLFYEYLRRLRNIKV